MKKKKTGRICLKRLFLALYIPYAVNIPLAACVWAGGIWPPEGAVSPAVRTGLLAAGLACTWLVWMAYNIMPRKKDFFASWRVTIMEGGRSLCYSALYGFAAQTAVLLWLYPKASRAVHDQRVLWINGIYSAIMLFILLWNGILRIFFTSVRLRLKYRILMLLAMWIPGLNLGVLLYAMRIVHGEYDFACYKESVRQVRAQSQICSTRYPLLLVHGVGFRDLRYFNYWGRIPRELARYGADIYYGNQEAFATVAYNAGDIYRKIQEICRETGCEKVNIIAHSKGGLDSRYAISRLGAAPMVASLTTINTPHRGCRFVDYACRLPEGLYRAIAGVFDLWFSRFGDSHPDFYTATHQFSTRASICFNEEVADAPGVYYQSYASVMRDFLSDPLLWFPYLIIRAVDGKNDGLVTPESAMWGEFKGTIANRKHRGISHGDMIDLKREDYKGFDVTEFYVELVKTLKEEGF